MHGGYIYNNDVDIDFSVNLNPYHMKWTGDDAAGSEDYSCEEAQRSHTGQILGSSLKEAISLGLEGSMVYPDPDQGSLREALSKADMVEPDCIYAGCGASQLLMSAIMSINPDRVMVTKPCFSGYEHALGALTSCRITGHDLKEEDDFALTGEIADKLTPDLDLIILADPDNPVGKNIDEKVLDLVLKRSDELDIRVILDESFLMMSDKYEYLMDLRGGAGKRTAGMIDKYRKLYIVRSYTKSFALPGIRMGYIISCPENIKGVRAHLPEWNLPALSEAVMKRCALLSKDGSFYRASLEMIRKERSFLEDGLSAMGFRVFKGNSLFLSFKGPDGLYEALLDKKILIRKCDDLIKGDERGSYYRVAVRSHEDNERLMDEMGKIVADGGERTS